MGNCLSKCRARLFKYRSGVRREQAPTCWDTQSYKLLHEYENPDYVNDVAWSPDGTSIAAACENGEILIWSSK
jgi:WD40 repeat protein